jgi:hypothetical protein
MSDAAETVKAWIVDLVGIRMLSDPRAFRKDFNARRTAFELP